jgi:hypothetical protein
MWYINAGEVCHCSLMAAGRQIGEEERMGETMGGNFTYGKNMVILSSCAMY